MKAVHNPAAPAAIGPYSPAIALPGLLFCSGQIALTAAGGFVDGDIEAQAEQVLDNLAAVLAAAGASIADVVKTTVFVTDLDEFARLNQVYERRFGRHKPARSTIQVARLPRDARVEIEAIARLA
jgi:2-iminobutanoate/2-iminopropanoate deaminase